mmetsp:Transcript_10641/g.25230  ORF Transcript_10641/g.25230 Transcript_10641/m.25230 type:complete len:183 (-) Transcript_10641:249-797(-)
MVPLCHSVFCRLQIAGSMLRLYCWFLLICAYAFLDKPVSAMSVRGVQPARAVLLVPPPWPLSCGPSQPLQERKELAAGNFRDRHNYWGSALLGLGVLLSIEGGLNTYLRVGKLFPGPHLFAGAGITVLWALAASLVPAMQKGNDTARSLHIALNTVNIGLFAWQLPTGFDIVLKVFKFAPWP